MSRNDREGPCRRGGVGPVKVSVHFQPEAWQNGYAVEIDPSGPQDWDGSTYWHELPLLYRRSLIERVNEYGEVLDRDDLYAADPAAPAWVREHRGPFTITLALDGDWP